MLAFKNSTKVVPKGNREAAKGGVSRFSGLSNRRILPRNHIVHLFNTSRPNIGAFLTADEVQDLFSIHNGMVTF
jgi:hypothetical protein